MSVCDKLMAAGCITPPRWVKNNVVYEVVTGSVAYGCNLTDKSDNDIRAVVMPPKDYVFPHTAGHVRGFGPKPPDFDKPYVKHHIEHDDQKYDLEIMGIVEYINLCAQNNPEKLDTLFVPQECIKSITAVGQMIRDNRRIFLCKACYPRFRGYALSQMSKMSTNKRTGNRAHDHEKHGFDTKFACHLVRLLYECEQILLEGNLDLRRHSEHLKAIRRGEVAEAEIRSWAASKEQTLETAFRNSTLPEEPNWVAVKSLLMSCLEQHFGRLDGIIFMLDRYQVALLAVRGVLTSVGM